MKKRILPFLLLTLLVSLSWGQTYIGAFAGFNSSKLLGDAPDKGRYSGKGGLNLGLNLDLRLHPSVWLSLQPSYSQEGAKIFFEVKGQDELVDSVRIGLDYFSLPVLFKVFTAKQKFYAVGGVEAGWLLDSYRVIEEVEGEIQSDVASMNLALHFGAGYRIPLGFPLLFFELRYSQGLVNLTDDPISKDYLPRVKTSGFKFFAGIEIPLSNPEK